MAEIFKPESSEMAKTWNPQEVEEKLYRIVSVLRWSAHLELVCEAIE